MDLITSVMCLVAEKSQIVAMPAVSLCLVLIGVLSFDLITIFYYAFFQPVKLAVVCRDGQLHLFEHILNG